MDSVRIQAGAQSAWKVHFHRTGQGGVHAPPHRDHLGQDADGDLVGRLRPDLEAERRVHVGQILRRHPLLMEGGEDVDDLRPAPEEAHDDR